MRRPSSRRLLRLLVALTIVIAGFSSSVTASTAPEGQITSAEYTDLVDQDGDGYYSAFMLDLQADTSLDDTDIGADDAGEPYFLVTLDDYTVFESQEVERSTSFSGTLPVSAETIATLPAGEYTLTIRLMDQDGDTRGDNDDMIHRVSGTIRIEPDSEDRSSESTTPTPTDTPSATPLEIMASRTATVVNAPVSLEADAGATWEIVDGPDRNERQIRVVNNRLTFEPNAPGEYTIRATPSTADRTANEVTISVSRYRDQALIERYAPVVNFHPDETFWPTRYEALVHNAQLEESNTLVVEQPTMTTLAGRDASHALDLYEDPSRYASARYPADIYGYAPTIYASVHETSLHGESYTAVTYWLFYLYDPKGGGTGGFLEHQSDLETVTILLQRGDPQYVAASQHKGGELREWSKTQRDGSHISIYPARGAHSTFLDDSSRYMGDGFIGQNQFMTRSSMSTSTLGAGVYTDITGSDTVWRHGAGGDVSYELVPLTGNEGWATYRGGFDDDPGDGVAPMQRGLWRNPGSWIESYYPSDEKQYDANIRNPRTAGDGDHVDVGFDLENTGPKPFDATIAVYAKHETESWSAAQPLGTNTVSLGTNIERSIDLKVGLPTGPDGTYDVVIGIFPYSMDVAEQEDVIEQVEVQSAFTYTAGTQPTTVRTATPTTRPPPRTTETTVELTTTSTTRTTTATTVNSSTTTATPLQSATSAATTTAAPEQNQNPGTAVTGPGFTGISALLAVSLLVLLARRLR